MAKTKTPIAVATLALDAFDRKLKELCPNAVAPETHMSDFRDQFANTVVEYVRMYMRNMN